MRERVKEDERSMEITLTAKGQSLQKKVRHIPELIEANIGLSPDDLQVLQGLLYKVLHNVKGYKI